MKKNITINLCGRLYQIDEDAYELLSQYTDTLRRYFLRQEGDEEIANDIEGRIAELFDELKEQGTVAITIEHVQEIIGRIGNVSDFAETDEAEDGDKLRGQQGSADGRTGGPDGQDGEHTGAKLMRGKRFYLDSQNKMLCGVLAGCAQYWGGSLSRWRWGYVAVVVLMYFVAPTFMFRSGEASPNSYEGWVSFKFLTYLPVLAYFLVAIVAPAATTAEDVLKMKGKEVNPQNLAAEVTSGTIKRGSQGSLWRFMTGVFSVCAIVLLGFFMVVGLCFATVCVVAPSVFGPAWMMSTAAVGQLQFLASLCGVTGLAALVIPLYCSIHSAASSFGSARPMTYKRRLMWFLLWVVAVASFVGCFARSVSWYSRHEREYYERMRGGQGATDDGDLEVQYTAEEAESVRVEDERAFLKLHEWSVKEYEGMKRYTNAGEYMTGDAEVRYLDGYNGGDLLMYHAEKKGMVQPGRYRLTAAVRSDKPGRFVFLRSEKVGSLGSRGRDSVRGYYAQIPHYGNVGGNIWETIKGSGGKSGSDPVVGELVDRWDDEMKARILAANEGRGFGWSYVHIDNIVVRKPTKLSYGVASDTAFPLEAGYVTLDSLQPLVFEQYTGWLSATDFQLTRIGGL